MSGIFNQLMTQEVAKQQQAIKKSKELNDPQSDSDATTSHSDAATSDAVTITSQNNLKTKSKLNEDKYLLDDALMREIIAELSDAKVLPNAISIRMTEEEKAYVDDFILDTLRKEKLQGHEVSIAKLMRYALTYLLLKHQQEFVSVLKKTLIKKESRKLFQ